MIVIRKQDPQKIINRSKKNSPEFITNSKGNNIFDWVFYLTRSESSKHKVAISGRLAEIDKDGNNIYYTTEKPLALVTTNNQAEKWIKKFLDWDETLQEKHLIKKKLKLQVSERKEFVCIGIIDEFGEGATHMIEKHVLMRGKEVNTNFDGIDRVKELLPNMAFIGSPSLRLSSNGKGKPAKITTSRFENQGRSSRKNKLMNFRERN